MVGSRVCRGIGRANRPQARLGESRIKDAGQVIGVGLGEGRGLIAVDVKDPQQRAAPIAHRQHKFGPCRGGAGDMAREAVNVMHQLHLASARSRPADPARERDHKAAVPALVGPDFEKLGAGDAVEPCPVKTVVAVVDFAGDGGHQRHHVGFARRERGDGAGQGRVVNAHDGVSGQGYATRISADRGVVPASSCQHRLAGAGCPEMVMV